MNEMQHLRNETIKKLNEEIIDSSTEKKYNYLEKDKYNLENKNIYYKNNLLTFISIIISIFFYYLSFKGCEGTQTYCLVTLSPEFFYLLGLYMIISTLIFCIFITNIIKRKISFLHLIYAIPLYIYIIYIHDTGGDLAKHGTYNKMVFYFLFVIFEILIFIILFLNNLRKKNYYKILLALFLGVIFVIVYFLFELRNGCNKWYDGLNGMRVINNPEKDKCYITHPKKCWINMIDGIFDVSRILKENCNNFRKGEREELIKYLPKRFNNTYNFAYPITLGWTWLNESHYDRFFKNVMNNMIDLDKDKKLKVKPEIFLKFNLNTNFGDISIKINRNEKIVKERQKIFKKLKKNEIPKYKNFLFIYIDALSRPHFIRKMKETQKFLSQFYNEQSSKKILYQMMKYHNFIYFTPPNVNPMFYGESMYNANGTNIIRAFKEKGYITGQSNDICSRELYDLENDYTKNMDFEDFDHENIAMMCDPNFHNYENPFTPYIGPYSIRRRCLYGKDTFEYVLEYGEKFLDSYKNERKFLRVAFQEAHEGTGEVVKYLDVRLRKFLESLDKKKHLDDTAIFIVSDHGNNMIGFYNIFQVEDFVMEKTLGTWLIILPKNSVNKKEDEILKKNQQNIVTPYDIHDTMLDIFKFEKNTKYKSRYGQTVFEEINNLQRNCETYKLDLQPLWCRCIDYKR